MKLTGSIFAIIAIVGLFVISYNQYLKESCIVKGGNITQEYRCINPDGQYID